MPNNPITASSGAKVEWDVPPVDHKSTSDNPVAAALDELRKREKDMSKKVSTTLPDEVWDAVNEVRKDGESDAQVLRRLVAKAVKVKLPK